MGRLEKEHGNKLFNDQSRDGGGCKTNGSVLEFDSQPPHAKVGEDDGSVRCCMPTNPGAGSNYKAQHPLRSLITVHGREDAARVLLL